MIGNCVINSEVLFAGDFLGIGKFFWKIITYLVIGIYHVVNYAYQIFLLLAQTNIFEQEDYQHLSNKVYVILGVVMLFIIAYNFLMVIVDPDKNKSGASVEKMIKNIVTSLILIVLCPTIFSFALRLQNVVLNQGVITRFFEGGDSEGAKKFDIQEGGRIMAVRTFSAFFTPADESMTNETLISLDTCTEYGRTCSIEEAIASAEKSGKFSVFVKFSGNLASDNASEEVEFQWLLALIAGGYLCYVIISFCFDLAVRVVKFAFLQIIAPLCISCRILPNKESIFKNWTKKTLETYFAVFIRVFIMNVCVYLISIFIHSDFWGKNACNGSSCATAVQLFGYVFIILGIITFMKQACKLIEELFGISDDMKLGIKDKLKAGGAFTAGAAAGSMITSGTRNATNAFKNVKNASGGKAKAKAAFKGIGSTIAGSGSGLRRGYSSGKSAGSWAEMRTAATNATNDTIAARENRQATYDRRYAEHNGNVVAGMFADFGQGISDWATGGASQYDATIASKQKIKSAFDKVDSAAKAVMEKSASNIAILGEDFEHRMSNIRSEYVDKKGNWKSERNPEIFNRWQTVYKDSTLAEVRADLERLRSMDITTLVDKTEFSTPEAYQAELDRVAVEHAKTVSNTESIVKTMEKVAVYNIEDASTGDPSKQIAGLKAEKLNTVRTAREEFVQEVTLQGGSITDTDDKQTKYTINSESPARYMDDANKANQRGLEDVQSKSYRLREQAKARKGEKGK